MTQEEVNNTQLNILTGGTKPVGFITEVITRESVEDEMDNGVYLLGETVGSEKKKIKKSNAPIFLVNE